MPDENLIYSQYRDEVVLIARHWYIKKKYDKDVKRGVEPPLSLGKLARFHIRDRTALDFILERTTFRYTYLDPKNGQETPLDSPEAVRNWVELLEAELRSTGAVENRICSVLKAQLSQALQGGKGRGQETTEAGGKARQKRNSITVPIGKKDVDLTHYEALCLMAYQDAVKDKRPYITPGIIAGRVWPDASLEAKTKRLKPHWSSLRNKLEKKGFKLADFSMKDVDGVRNYQLGKPPAWLKEVAFPKTLALPLKLARRG